MQLAKLRRQSLTMQHITRGVWALENYRGARPVAIGAR
jgi:hypothetical protein